MEASPTDNQKKSIGSNTMTSLSNIFLTRGNEKSRDAYCLALFEKAWEQAEQEKRIPGAKEVNRHLITVLQDVIEPEDFRNITRLRNTISKWEFSSDLKADQRRQLAIIQLVLLTEIFDNQYQELLQAVRVRELTRCCDEFIRKREEKLNTAFTAPLSTINLEKILDSQLKLDVYQYQAVLTLQSTLCVENIENRQKVFTFSRAFNICKSILEASADSLCIQFIRKVLDLLPTALTSYFGFFRTDTQQLVRNVEDLTDVEYGNPLIPA